MIKQTIELPKDFNSYSKIIFDYLNNSNRLEDFFNYSPNLNGLLQRTETRTFKDEYREVLHNTLKQQYHKIQTHKAVIQNINKLKNKNTFTICTGHQLCFLTGPLFVIYKIVSVIKLTKLLNEKYPQYHYVPVFWLASEDHDFEEINHVNLFNKKYAWNTAQKGGVGSFNTSSTLQVLQELKELFLKSPNGNLHFEKCMQAYQNKNLSEATIFLIDYLFSEYGLICLDANTVDLKKIFAPIMVNEIKNDLSYKATTKTTRQLINLGYKPAAEAKEINLFYLENNLRERIEKQEEKYIVKNTSLTFTQNELIEKINNEPDKFSPNVILRPVYQETILPNIAYIGGPGETAYWLQLKETFNIHQTPFPVLMLRNSFYLLSEKLWTAFVQAGFATGDLKKESSLLVDELLQKINFQPFSINSTLQQLSTIVNELKQQVNAIDITLINALQAEEQKFKNSLHNIESKLNKVLKQKHEQPINTTKKVTEKLFYNHVPQERIENVFQYLINDTDTNFINELINLANPLSHSSQLITY